MIGKTAWRLALTLAVLSTIGCDRVTKHAATTFLSGLPSRSYLADTVRLGYVENTGGFLSLGAELPSAVRTGLFTVGTGLLLCMLVFIAIRWNWDRLSKLGLALFVAGGASNWVDRVAQGSVVDFLNVGVGSVRTGVFNVADVAIMLGGVVIVMATYWKRHASPPSVRADDTGNSLEFPWLMSMTCLPPIASPSSTLSRLQRDQRRLGLRRVRRGNGRRAR